MEDGKGFFSLNSSIVFGLRDIKYIIPRSRLKENDCGKIFSYNDEVGLFEEVISFEDIEEKLESSPFLKDIFDNYILKFTYPFPYYFYYNSFKEKLKSGYECPRISCMDNGDLINFIFFDHFIQFPGIEFSYRELEGIEFLNDDGSFSNITEKVNDFIDYNLSALNQPSFAIVLPIKSFKILSPKFEENDEKKCIYPLEVLFLYLSFEVLTMFLLFLYHRGINRW